MKNSLILALFIVLLFSCKQSNKINSPKSTTEISTNNIDFINVDLKYFTDTIYTFGYKEIPEKEMERIKTAIYRIYSNIELKNNQYVLNIKKGSDINISENIFKIYKKNIDLINQAASSQKISKLPPITSEYINSLIAK